eukprot:s240_g11.t1
MGGEKEPLGMSELGCADGCGRRGCKGVGGGNGWGEAAAGNERAWVRGRLRTAANSVGASGRVEMGGEKEPLGMTELRCADGCGRRWCKGIGGNEWGGGAAGDERAPMRGRLRTAWVQGREGKWVGR